MKNIRKLRTYYWCTVNQTPVECKLVEGTYHYLDFTTGNWVEIPSEMMVGDWRHEAHDAVWFANARTTTVAEYVTHKLDQLFRIQAGEVVYPYSGAINGIPLLDKKNRTEMDLVLKNQVLNVTGVRQINRWQSRIEDHIYKVDFEVQTESSGGTVTWQIAI